MYFINKTWAIINLGDYQAFASINWLLTLKLVAYVECRLLPLGCMAAQAGRQAGDCVSPAGKQCISRLQGGRVTTEQS